MISLNQLSRPVVFVVDFDGTCVTHDFPEIGDDIGAEIVLKALIDKGHKIILFTMRSDNEIRPYLAEAVEWFISNDIPLYGVNTNPTQHKWTTSPKAHGDIFIDDRNIGIPTIKGSVNWYRVTLMLQDIEIFDHKETISILEKLRTKYPELHGCSF